MAEMTRQLTQAEIDRILFNQSMGLDPRGQVPMPSVQNLQQRTSGTITPVAPNFAQLAAGGANRVGQFLNQILPNAQQVVAANPLNLEQLFPTTAQPQVTIPTGFNFAPKQAPTGEVIPGGLQSQQVNLNQLLSAIKPADVLGVSGAERAYTDIGMGKAPNTMDVIDTLALGAGGMAAGRGLLKAGKGLPVGMSIQEATGLLQTAPKSDIGFYSAVEQAAMASPRKSATGQAFLNDIIKGQDVRADEIKWMGLDDYLKGKQNVTKQEVQDYIANNRVNVQEVRLGESVAEDPIGIAKRKAIFDKYEPEIQARYKEMDNPSYVLIDRQVSPQEYQRGVILQNRGYRGEQLTVQEQAELNDIMNRFEGKPIREFVNNEEARKFLLSMSQEDRIRHSILPKTSSRQLQDQINEIQNIRDAEADATYVVPEPTPTKFPKYQLLGGENYRELLLTMPNKNMGGLDAAQIKAGSLRKQTTDLMADWKRISEEKPGSPEAVAAYQKVAESRKAMNEAENAVNLMKDEIKSRTYIGSHFPQENILAHLRVNDRVDADGKKMLLIEEVQSDWHQAGREKGYKTKENLENWYNQNKLNDDPPFSSLNSEQISVIERNRNAGMGGDTGVPDAPFKDTWYQLALKRAIQHAAENGYDRIGLTTGSQQAARFDLSKQLNQVTYRDGVLHGYDKSGALVMNQAVTPNELPNYVGKELGAKMAENAVKDAEIRNKISVARYERKPESEINALRSQLDDVKTDYAGLDLQVGGEGMKKYYDEIYPKFLDKYGKKWGAKVGETKVNTVMERAENSMIPTMGQEGVRYLDITPEMKAGVSKGQPLFQAAPIIGTGLLGSQQEDR